MVVDFESGKWFIKSTNQVCSVQTIADGYYIVLSDTCLKPVFYNQIKSKMVSVQTFVEKYF